MAQETAAKLPPRNVDDVSARQASALEDFLKQYRRQDGDTARQNILDNRYQIDLSIPLPEYNTATARAYAATDLRESGKPHFALLCALSSVQRHRAISQMQKAPHPNLLSIKASGVVHLSQPAEERFAIVYERPNGRKLSELIAVSGKINETFICKSIIAPIAAAIEHLSSIDIAHGSINLDNIYFQDKLTLGDCVSAPCGYNQIFYYEPLERLQALPAGKGEGNTSCDYYALAVVTLQILHGINHFQNITMESLVEAIMHEGAYNALTRGKETSELFYDFFRGLLTQNSSDRWNHRYLKPWLDGKRYNVLLPPPPVGAVRGFEFCGKEANNRREVAHLLYVNWDKIHTILENNALLYWVSNNLRNKELADGVNRLSRSALECHGKNELLYSECIMRLLLLLDPAGPIRIGSLSMHVDGIDMLCAQLFVDQNDKALQILGRFIELNLSSYWMEQQKKSVDFEIPHAVNAMTIKLDKLRIIIRNSSLGFGQERMLYELNPEMPCQSKLFANSYVGNISTLLKKIDYLCPLIGKDHDPMDRHIAAFIASKMNLQHELHLRELSDLPVIGTHRSVLTLKLLSMAEYKAGEMILPGITSLLALRIMPAIAKLRSKTIRTQLQNAMVQYAEMGSLEGMANLIINPDYATAEQDGFERATQLYQSNAQHIDAYRKGENIDVLSNNLGLALSKLMAYGAFFLTLFALMQGM